MITVSHPYGTRRRAVVQSRMDGVWFIVDENNNGHVLIGGACDSTAVIGDTGTLTFTKGGPTGGYWKFTKD